MVDWRSAAGTKSDLFLQTCTGQGGYSAITKKAQTATVSIAIHAYNRFTGIQLQF